MESFASGFQNLEAGDIASILRQVQSGSLKLQDTEISNNSPQQADNNIHTGHNIHDIVDTVTESDSLISPDIVSNTHDYISLKRPGRVNVPPLLQSNDSDIVVPLSKNELSKQIFAARMMGAPADIANRISQRVGLTSPPNVKPNIGLSRSAPHTALHNEKDTCSHILNHVMGDLSQESTRLSIPQTSSTEVKTVCVSGSSHELSPSNSSYSNDRIELQIISGDRKSNEYGKRSLDRRGTPICNQYDIDMDTFNRKRSPDKKSESTSTPLIPSRRSRSPLRTSGSSHELSPSNSSYSNDRIELQIISSKRKSNEYGKRSLDRRGTPICNQYDIDMDTFNRKISPDRKSESMSTPLIPPRRSRSPLRKFENTDQGNTDSRVNSSSSRQNNDKAEQIESEDVYVKRRSFDRTGGTSTTTIEHDRGNTDKDNCEHKARECRTSDQKRSQEILKSPENKCRNNYHENSDRGVPSSLESRTRVPALSSRLNQSRNNDPGNSDRRRSLNRESDRSLENQKSRRDRKVSLDRSGIDRNRSASTRSSDWVDSDLKRDKGRYSKKSKHKVDSQRGPSKGNFDIPDDLACKEKTKSTEKSQDPFDQITSEENTAFKEAQEIDLVVEEPLPDIVFSQVDKQAATCSFESLSQFKIPKKAKPTSDTKSASSAKKKKLTTSPEDSHKRGAAHEKVGSISQTWHGVESFHGRVSKSISTNKTSMSNSKAREILMMSEWFGNLALVRSVLPEIPEVHVFLSKEECRELQEEFQAEFQATIKKNKAKKYIGGQQYKLAKKTVNKDKTEFVKKIETQEKCKQSQINLFKQLNMNKYFRAINHAELFKDQLFCYLCQKDYPQLLQYNIHLGSKIHLDNIARAKTTVGKMFFIKFLQSVAKKGSLDKLDTSKGKENKDLLNSKCEVCHKKYKGSLKRHNKTQEHKDAVERFHIRPKCEVCDIVFNTEKDQRHHMTRSYHKTNVERKMEYGELPSDYKDPVIGGESSQEEDNSSEKVMSLNADMLAISDDGTSADELMEVDDWSSDDADKDCKLPNMTIKADSQNKVENDSQWKTRKDDKEFKERLDKLHSHKNYGEWEYFQDFLTEYPGIQGDVWKHLSRQDWIDVVDEYRVKMEETNENPAENYKNAKEYAKKKLKPKTIEQSCKEVGNESSLNSQTAALDWLRLTKYITGKAMAEWFCCVCMTPTANSKLYAIHMVGKKHQEYMARARTTIGRMLFIKYLQSLPASQQESPIFTLEDADSKIPVKEPVVATKKYCTDCSNAYEGNWDSHVRTTEHEIAEQNKLCCIVCDQMFSTQTQKEEHFGNVYHCVNVACKMEHGLLPSEYEDHPEGTGDTRLSIVEKDMCVDNIPDAEVIALGHQLMSEVTGLYCIACGYYFDKFDGVTLERARQEHSRDTMHRVKLQVYKKNLKERGDNDTIQEKSSTTSSMKRNSDSDILKDNVKLRRCSVDLIKVSTTDIIKYSQMDIEDALTSVGKGESGSTHQGIKSDNLYNEGDNNMPVFDSEQNEIKQVASGGNTMENSKPLDEKNNHETDIQRQLLPVINPDADSTTTSDAIREYFELGLQSDDQCARTRVYNRLPQELRCEF